MNEKIKIKLTGSEVKCLIMELISYDLGNIETTLVGKMVIESLFKLLRRLQNKVPIMDSKKYSISFSQGEAAAFLYLFNGFRSGDVYTQTVINNIITIFNQKFA